MSVLRGMVYGTVLGWILFGSLSVLDGGELIHLPGEFIGTGAGGALLGFVVGSVWGIVVWRGEAGRS